MIDLYTWATPNGRKISIALEEMGLPYDVHRVDIGKNQQFDSAFAAHEYVADEYSIADMALWPWASRFAWQGVSLADFEHVRRWYRTLANRRSVVRGYKVPDDSLDIPWVP